MYVGTYSPVEVRDASDNKKLQKYLVSITRNVLLFLTDELLFAAIWQTRGVSFNTKQTMFNVWRNQIIQTTCWRHSSIFVYYDLIF